MLDYTQLHAGAIQPIIRQQELGALSRAVLKKNEYLAVAKKQSISFSMAPYELSLQTDGEQLSKALVHLLSNAIKFTPEGGSLGVKITGNRQANQVKIVVWDTGIGICEEDLPKLFQPFSQLDASLARQYEGTGLGLAITGKVVELLCGKISVSSKPGGGSSFTIQLPWNDREQSA